MPKTFFYIFQLFTFVGAFAVFNLQVSWLLCPPPSSIRCSFILRLLIGKKIAYVPVLIYFTFMFHFHSHLLLVVSSSPSFSLSLSPIKLLSLRRKSIHFWLSVSFLLIFHLACCASTSNKQWKSIYISRNIQHKCRCFSILTDSNNNNKNNNNNTEKTIRSQTDYTVAIFAFLTFSWISRNFVRVLLNQFFPKKTFHSITSFGCRLNGFIHITFWHR